MFRDVYWFNQILHIPFSLCRKVEKIRLKFRKYIIFMFKIINGEYS